MNATRDALIYKHEQLVLASQKQHEAIMAILRGFTNGDIPLKIQVTAGFGELAATGQNQPGLPAVNLHSGPSYTNYPVSSALAESFQHPGPPKYLLFKCRSVHDVWKEWSEGINGGPAVAKLEDEWGPAWRSTPAARVAFCRRKVIIDYIKAEVAKGLQLATVLGTTDFLRGGRSLNWVRENISCLATASPQPRKKRKRHSEG